MGRGWATAGGVQSLTPASAQGSFLGRLRDYIWWQESNGGQLHEDDQEEVLFLPCLRMNLGAGEIAQKAGDFGLLIWRPGPPPSVA